MLKLLEKALTRRDLLGTHLREQQQTYRHYVGELAHAFVLLDTAGTVILLNTPLCAMLDLEAEALVGRPWSNVVVQTLKRSEASATREEILRSGRWLVWALSALQPVRREEVVLGSQQVMLPLTRWPAEEPHQSTWGALRRELFSQRRDGICSECNPDVERALPGVALTQREREVVQMLVRGMATASIAARLNVSHHTIRNHLKNVCKKGGLTSQAELREVFSGTLLRPAPRRPAK